jgi:hypothetical protein
LIRSEVGFIGFYNAQYRFCVRLFPSLELPRWLLNKVKYLLCCLCCLDDIKYNTIFLLI